MCKRILFISAAVLLVLGCTKEMRSSQEEATVKVGVSLSQVQTRTYLDPSVTGGRRQVCWSEGDAVNLNGYTSLPLTADQAGKSSADFMFYNGTGPFSIIYPASICEGSKYAEDGTIMVDIPAVQEYSATSFGNGAAVLYGYGETQPVTLNNLCGAVRVTVKGQKTIRKALLISNDRSAAIAGKYCLNPRTGAYTVQSGISSVSLDINDVSLGEDGQSFYFTIPYGRYAKGFTVKFYDVEDYPMECVWLRNGQEAEGVTVEAGKLYEFRPVGFVAGKKEILTGEDWNYIATQINEGKTAWEALYLDEKTNTIKLGADIILDKEAVQIKSLKYTIDGNGFSVVNQEATNPLVYDLPEGGVIRDLTLSGNMVSESTDVSTFVYSVSGGTIENCINEMNVTATARTMAFGTFARTITSGALKGCVNKGNVDVTLVNETGTTVQKGFGGGVVATCFTPTAVSVIEDCVNEGNVTVMMRVGTYLGFSRAGFGGIIGYISGAGADKTCMIRGCENKGTIRVDIADSQVSAPKIQYSVGGILGLASALTTSDKSGSVTPTASKIADPRSANTVNSYVFIEGCSNFGHIQNNTFSRCESADIFTKIFTGGIAGTVIGRPEKYSVIKDCISKGTVSPYSVKMNPYSRAALCGVCGGILGLGGYVDISGGTVEAEVGTPDALSFSVGGVIGTALTRFLISGMDIRPRITMVQCNDHTKDNYALAVVNSTTKLANTTDLSGSEIKGCSFGGSFFTAATAKYTDACPYPEKVVAVTSEDIMNGRYIISASYTKNGVTLSENTFSGAN